MRTFIRWAHILCATLSLPAFCISGDELSLYKRAIEHENAAVLKGAPTSAELNATLEDELLTLKKASAHLRAVLNSADEDLENDAIRIFNDAKYALANSIECAGLLFPAEQHSLRIVVQNPPHPTGNEATLDHWPLTSYNEIFLQMPYQNLTPNGNPWQALTSRKTTLRIQSSRESGVWFHLDAYGDNGLFAPLPRGGSVSLKSSQVAAISIVTTPHWANFLLQLTESLLADPKEARDHDGLLIWQNHLIQLGYRPSTHHQ